MSRSRFWTCKSMRVSVARHNVFVCNFASITRASYDEENYKENKKKYRKSWQLLAAPLFHCRDHYINCYCSTVPNPGEFRKCKQSVARICTQMRETHASTVLMYAQLISKMKRREVFTVYDIIVCLPNFLLFYLPCNTTCTKLKSPW